MESPKYPIYHELKYSPGEYERVQWSPSVCIRKGRKYILPETGLVMEVISIFKSEGGGGPMVEYTVNGIACHAMPLESFANNFYLMYAL